MNDQEGKEHMDRGREEKKPKDKEEFDREPNESRKEGKRRTKKCAEESPQKWGEQNEDVKADQGLFGDSQKGHRQEKIEEIGGAERRKRSEDEEKDGMRGKGEDSESAQHSKQSEDKKVRVENKGEGSDNR